MAGDSSAEQAVATEKLIRQDCSNRTACRPEWKTGWIMVNCQVEEIGCDAVTGVSTTTRDSVAGVSRSTTAGYKRL